uniref:RNA helicase n=1 Tax=Astyanax mexicanus TaxID=7994 RepID=A0A8B9JTX8_ASTMX
PLPNYPLLFFWRLEGPGVSEERELSTEPSGPVLIYNPHSTLSVEKQRQKLPVFKHRNNILYLVESFQTVVIVGETGCGKSTQIPQYLLEAGWAAEGKVIGVTQPRRVAATSVANRVAEERGALLGHEVGYTIRFDDCSDPHATRIKIQRKRRDLRLIVASATLDAKVTQCFSVRENRERDERCVQTFGLYCMCVLYMCFSVQEEVEKVVSMLQDQARTLSRYGIKKHLRVLPMYAGLPYAEQMKVFERLPPTVRKVVVATNIAETSITINGIVFVIDCAFVKLRAYNPRTAIESLVVTPISKASAAQRAGRAGRNRPGKCFRLYTEEDFEKLPESTVPEMQRSNLAPVILQLKALGIDNVLRFSFLSPPPAQSMVQALELLYALGGLDQYGRLTEPMGIRMAEFPLSPMFAKMLLESGNFGCSKEIVTIAAMMQIQNIFVFPSDQKKAAAREHRKFAVAEGDHLTMLNVYEAFVKHQKSSQWCQEHFLNYKGLVRAMSVREQLRRLLNKFKVPRTSSEGDPDVILRCIVSGFFANAARLHHSGSYRTLRDDRELHIHPNSVLYGEKPQKWVVFNEVVQTSKYFMRDVTAVESAWLVELAPHFYKQAKVRKR